MTITTYNKEEKKRLEAERDTIQKWLDDNVIRPGAAQVGGQGMIVDRDTAGHNAFTAETNLRKTRMSEIQALLGDEAALSRMFPAPDAQKLDEAAGIGHADPNAKRVNSLAEALAGFDTANIEGPAGALPDATKRAQANLLAGAVSPPQGKVANFVQLLRTSVPGAGNQQSLETLMQQLNAAKTSGQIDFGALNAAVSGNRTPVPELATTRAGMEAAVSSSGRTIEQVLADTLADNKNAAGELAGGTRALAGLGAEARGAIKGRQQKAVAGAGAALAGAYGLSGPSETDKARKLFRDTYYAEGGGPGSGLIDPKDDADYDAALGASFDAYSRKMIGEKDSARYGSYLGLVEKNKATIGAIGRGDLSLSADDAGLKEFRRSVADFYARNGYKEDKPLAFPYRNKEGKRAVFMTGKMGDTMARLMAKGEFEMAD